MASGKKLILHHNFKKKFGTIYDCVLDFKKFGEHHPFMTEVTEIKQTDTYTEYHVKEKLLVLGFIPQKPEYDAKVFEVEKNKHIRYTSLVMGKIALTMNFYFTEDKNGEINVRENINLEGNPILCNILMSTIKKTHLILFGKLGGIG